MIGELQKNKTQRIRVSEQEYHGHKLLDIRVYYLDKDGEYKPTKKGISIQIHQIPELIELMKKSEKDNEEKE